MGFSLISRCFRQCGAVAVDLPDRLEDVIHVATVGQEQTLVHRHGRIANLLVAFQLMEAVAIRLETLRAEEALNPREAIASSNMPSKYCSE